MIDDPRQVDVGLLKQRCASLHWEAVFCRSSLETADMIEQGRILDRVAGLVDQGVLATTPAQSLGPVNAANLRRGHALIESGRTLGKLVLEGFGD